MVNLKIILSVLLAWLLPFAVSASDERVPDKLPDTIAVHPSRGFAGEECKISEKAGNGPIGDKFESGESANQKTSHGPDAINIPFMSPFFFGTLPIPLFFQGYSALVSVPYITHFIGYVPISGVSGNVPALSVRIHENPPVTVMDTINKYSGILTVVVAVLGIGLTTILSIKSLKRFAEDQRALDRIDPVRKRLGLFKAEIQYGIFRLLPYGPGIGRHRRSVIVLSLTNGRELYVDKFTAFRFGAVDLVGRYQEDMEKDQFARHMTVRFSSIANVCEEVTEQNMAGGSGTEEPPDAIYLRDVPEIT